MHNYFVFCSTKLWYLINPASELTHQKQQRKEATNISTVFIDVLGITTIHVTLLPHEK